MLKPIFEVLEIPFTGKYGFLRNQIRDFDSVIVIVVDASGSGGDVVCVVAIIVVAVIVVS